MEEDMRAFLEARAARERQVKDAKEAYSRDVTATILDKQQHKAKREQSKAEAVNSPKAFNQNVQKVYMAGQLRDYSNFMFKQQKNQHKMADYEHKAQYAQEVNLRR